MNIPVFYWLWTIKKNELRLKSNVVVREWSSDRDGHPDRGPHLGADIGRATSIRTTTRFRGLNLAQLKALTEGGNTCFSLAV